MGFNSGLKGLKQSSIVQIVGNYCTNDTLLFLLGLQSSTKVFQAVFPSTFPFQNSVCISVDR